MGVYGLEIVGDITAGRRTAQPLCIMRGGSYDPCYLFLIRRFFLFPATSMGRRIDC